MQALRPAVLPGGHPLTSQTDLCLPRQTGRCWPGSRRWCTAPPSSPFPLSPPVSFKRRGITATTTTTNRRSTVDSKQGPDGKRGSGAALTHTQAKKNHTHTQNLPTTAASKPGSVCESNSAVKSSPGVGLRGRPKGFRAQQSRAGSSESGIGSTPKPKPSAVISPHPSDCNEAQIERNPTHRLPSPPPARSWGKYFGTQTQAASWGGNSERQSCSRPGYETDAFGAADKSPHAQK